MDPDSSGEPSTEPHSEKWLEYYAEASRRRRARGWHRRRHLRARRRIPTRWLIGGLLGLAALATILTLVLPR